MAAANPALMLEEGAIPIREAIGMSFRWRRRSAAAGSSTDSRASNCRGFAEANAKRNGPPDPAMRSFRSWRVGGGAIISIAVE
jgi:hypothetical protein